MYLKALKIENIRSFDTLSLDFSSASDVRRWVLILGSNGVGKTTLLRCIALGMCGDSSAAALLTELAVGDLSRHETDKDPRISVTLVAPDTLQEFHITTQIKKGASGPNVSVKTKPETFPWEKIFCCAYGIARRPFTYDAYTKYRIVDSVYTLFNYESSLWTPEVVLSRLQRTSIDFEDLLRRLEDILEFQEGSLSLGDKGIVIRGAWKGELGLNALGDGYSATLGWLLDMLGWGLLHYGAKLDVNSFQGIVLVDMIERDLHPSWQLTILKSLRKHFRGIQFIATTHAPMSAIGTAELTDEECELVALHWKDDRAEAIEDLRPPRKERVDEVLTSLLFNVSAVSGSDLRNALERFTSLSSRKRSAVPLTEEEDNELDSLRKELHERIRLQSFESRLLEFLSAATAEELQRQVTDMSDGDLKSGIEFVEKLRAAL